MPTNMYKMSARRRGLSKARQDLARLPAFLLGQPGAVATSAPLPHAHPKRHGHQEVSWGELYCPTADGKVFSRWPAILLDGVHLSLSHRGQMVATHLSRGLRASPGPDDCRASEAPSRSSSIARARALEPI